MKYLFKIALFLFLPLIGWAQNTVVNITPENFSKEINAFALDTAEGWVFHKGNNTTWSKKDINTKGWEKLKPTDLSAKYADKNGRVEGWFRIKVTLDSSLLNKVLHVDFGQWAATAFYVDGKLVAARGDTGDDEKTFREYYGGLDPLPMRFNSSGPHVISLHYVSYLSAIPPHNVKTQMKNVIFIGGPNYSTVSNRYYKTLYSFYTFWLVVCAILSLLFWLLLFQNRKEKILLWSALYTSTFTLFIYCWSSLNDIIGSTYNVVKSYQLLTGILQSGTFILLLPILLIKVFKRKINNKLILTLLFLYVIGIIMEFLPASFTETKKVIDVAPSIFVGGVCLYYVITSWKNLKGAQWAIVAGLIFTVFILLFFMILGQLNQPTLFSFYLFVSLYFLAFPLSLLVYVSMRFKEMLKEVQANAKTVVELSEEKREQALIQQKILEEEVARQTGEIRQTLENLKSTQSQLIQSEKMASLGELTAGIAHEIQNPLNFVNNFSEVSSELLDDMNDELNKGDIEEAKAISSDIKQNLEKITHHGKRADAIVKGMLQHSRSSSGIMEPTDLNALCDEYLRLSYHGLRAKDKSFNATIKTNFDATVEKVNLIPQDFGRVVLNLLTNAFYTVDEKYKNQKTLNKGNSYQPTVTIATKKQNERVIITVTDNGNGMPQEVIEKIFHPFFTTKPTGKGTGLGLSMSYDIITKGHNGELKATSIENEGTTFSIMI